MRNVPPSSKLFRGIGSPPLSSFSPPIASSKVLFLDEEEEEEAEEEEEKEEAEEEEEDEDEEEDALRFVSIPSSIPLNSISLRIVTSETTN